jgi:hypothetical protein
MEKPKLRTMNEKDPFGDKLREKERADEDLYFAKRDRQLMEKLRQQDDAGREAELQDLARGRCPRCGERLTHRVIEDVEVDECASHHGMWLDRGELEILSQREGESWLGRLFRHTLTQAR